MNRRRFLTLAGSAALKFQEAVERHGIHLTPCHPPLTEAYWLAQTCIRGQEAMAPTPAAAVASLVSELEKAK